MTDHKTTPAPAVENKRPRIECACGSEFCDECSPPFGRVIRTRLSTHLAQLRAADARSARRFEGL